MSYAVAWVPYPHELRAMSVEELHAFMRAFLDAIPRRIPQLTEVVRESKGYETWEGDLSPYSLDTLGEWFVPNIRTRLWTPEEKERMRRHFTIVNIWTPTERTFSLAFDIGIYLSQVFMKGDPSLQWEQLIDDKKRPGYGMPLLTRSGRVLLDPVGEVIGLTFELAANPFGGKKVRRLYDMKSGRAIPDDEQVEALLNESIRELLPKYISNLPETFYYDPKRYLTVNLLIVEVYLRTHPEKAEAYFQRHSRTPSGHDAPVLWREGAEYLVAWMDHGRAIDISRFNSCPEAVAYFVLIRHGMSVR